MCYVISHRRYEQGRKGATYIISGSQGSMYDLGKLFILTKFGKLTWEPVVSTLASAPLL